MARSDKVMEDIVAIAFFGNIVTVLWQEEGSTMKYSLSPREILRAKPEGFPEDSGYISLYIPSQVTIQTF